MPTNPYQNAAAAYQDHKITTASPTRIVVLIFERLTLDLERAITALDTNQSPHEHLVHAQELLTALLDALDTNAWEHAPQLASIYLTVHRDLITANIDKNPQLIHSALTIITGLKDAWTQAQAQAGDMPGHLRVGVVDA